MNEMTRRLFLGTAGMAAAGPAVGTIAAQNSASDRGSVSIEKNIVFGKGGNTDLRLDIYRPPAGTEKRMATIHIHGGGLTGGSKETLAERALLLATAGYVAIPVQYRLVGEAKENSERLFKQLRDAQVPAEFHALEGVPHVFDSNPEFARSAGALADFFIDRHVINPRTSPPFGGGGRGGR